MKNFDLELKKIISTVLKVKTEKINMKFNQSNCPKWDSLNHVRLIMAIESKYKIKIKPEISFQLLSFKKIYLFLKKN